MTVITEVVVLRVFAHEACVTIFRYQRLMIDELELTVSPTMMRQSSFLEIVLLRLQR
jgi:hypothetical protein